MFLKIGHRGIPKLEPENTLRGFRKALELGANALECDVHLTRDGKVVVIHDYTVLRTTKKRGKVNKLTLERIRKLNTKGEKIPTLKEVLKLVRGKCHLNIEVKDSKATEKVLDLVEKQDYSHIFLSSTKLKVLFDIRKRNKDIKTGLVFYSTKVPFKIRRLFDKSRRTEVNSVSLSKKLATKSLIKKLHDRNLKVYVWTVNKKKLIDKMKEWGADGVFTDDVRLFQ